MRLANKGEGALLGARCLGGEPSAGYALGLATVCLLVHEALPAMIPATSLGLWGCHREPSHVAQDSLFAPRPCDMAGEYFLAGAVISLPVYFFAPSPPDLLNLDATVTAIAIAVTLGRDYVVIAPLHLGLPLRAGLLGPTTAREAPWRPGVPWTDSRAHAACQIGTWTLVSLAMWAKPSADRGLLSVTA